MKIKINGYIPRPKARVRIFKNGNKIKAHSPTGKSEKSLANFITMYKNANYPLWDQFTTPVAVDINIAARKPLRGDLDNYVKTILDALQKAKVISNDKLVWGINAQFFITKNEFTEIKIREIKLSNRLLGGLTNLNIIQKYV